MTLPNFLHAAKLLFESGGIVLAAILASLYLRTRASR